MNIGELGTVRSCEAASYGPRIRPDLVRYKLAYKEEELVLSKKEGGEWALTTLPVEYHALIRDAMREYVEGTEAAYDEELARRYAEYMLNQIRCGIQLGMLNSKLC